MNNTDFSYDEVVFKTEENAWESWSKPGAEGRVKIFKKRKFKNYSSDIMFALNTKLQVTRYLYTKNMMVFLWSHLNWPATGRDLTDTSIFDASVPVKMESKFKRHFYYME